MKAKHLSFVLSLSQNPLSSIQYNSSEQGLAPQWPVKQQGQGLAASLINGERNGDTSSVLRVSWVF